MMVDGTVDIWYTNYCDPLHTVRPILDIFARWNCSKPSISIFDTPYNACWKWADKNNKQRPRIDVQGLMSPLWVGYFSFECNANARCRSHGVQIFMPFHFPFFLSFLLHQNWQSCPMSDAIIHNCSTGIRDSQPLRCAEHGNTKYFRWSILLILSNRLYFRRSVLKDAGARQIFILYSENPSLRTPEIWRRVVGYEKFLFRGNCHKFIVLWWLDVVTKYTRCCRHERREISKILVFQT